MSSLFKNIAIRKPSRNAFDLSHERKFSFNMGELIPILCEDVVPGDSFRINTEVLLRLAPLVSPMMHQVNVYTHFFFVPNRLVWEEWESFITGGEDGTEAPVFPFKLINDSNQASYQAGTLADYLGINLATDDIGDTKNIQVSALPFRAYTMIYNEFYRDQNLHVKATVNTTSGNDGGASIAKRIRCWEKDYFTSALPWTQRGAEVTTPLGGTADINFVSGNAASFKNVAGAGIDGDINSSSGTMHAGVVAGTVDNASSLEADLSTATSTTINELRRATRLQEWLEKNARGGSRYIEQIMSHFGVKSSDSRLQRPEFLGGGKQPVVISEVLQTSETSTSPQGNMAGHGISGGNSNSFKRYFEEHGQIIGIMSVMPRTSYMNGLRKQFFRFDKFDHFWPSFANLGEQPVLNKEVYNNALDTQDDVFGYQSRYSDYKNIPSTVHGDFKNSLQHWTLVRDFANEPALNSDFVECDPSHRVFAVTDPDEHKLICQVYNNVKAKRPMPYFSTPQL